MLKRNKNKSIYERALEKKKENLEKERLYDSLNLDRDKNNIIIEKEKHTLIKILNFIMDLAVKIIKLMVILAIFILLTIGATVLLNPELRLKVLEILQNANLLT
ncbi:hypothetical protein [uncultured Clostridium sp.]|jgi:hypothetical protein|uniref:hypothetical protein n=1 Tax=uncultured Clostridium sp. TaxID=59620 RepID=UPI00272DB64A|nr:hypothetical protein [uncultured Clostridium sp.]